MKKFILILIAFSAAFISAKADSQALNLQMKDGTVHSFLLSEMPVITMENNQLIVTSSNTTAVYDLYSVSMYAYGEPSSGINQTTIESKFTRLGDNIIFNGIDNAEKVRIYSVNGTIINANKEASGNNVIVSLSEIPAGIYIVKANNITVKITKR